MARLRSEAVALGAFPVLTRDLSSWQVTSRTLWSLSPEGLDAASPGQGKARLRAASRSGGRSDLGAAGEL
jgi:hypothetical protein